MYTGISLQPQGLASSAGLALAQHKHSQLARAEKNCEVLTSSKQQNTQTTAVTLQVLHQNILEEVVSRRKAVIPSDALQAATAAKMQSQAPAISLRLHTLCFPTSTGHGPPSACTYPAEMFEQQAKLQVAIRSTAPTPSSEQRAGGPPLRSLHNFSILT